MYICRNKYGNFKKSDLSGIGKTEVHRCKNVLQVKLISFFY